MRVFFVSFILILVRFFSQELPSCSQNSISRSNSPQSESVANATLPEDRPTEHSAASVENQNVCASNIAEKMQQSCKNKKSANPKRMTSKRAKLSHQDTSCTVISKLNDPEQIHDIPSPDLYVPHEPNHEELLSTPEKKENCTSNEHSDGKKFKRDKNAVLSFKTGTKRAHNESKSQIGLNIPEKIPRSADENLPNCSQAAAIDSVASREEKPLSWRLRAIFSSDPYDEHETNPSESLSKPEKEENCTSDQHNDGKKSKRANKQHSMSSSLNRTIQVIPSLPIKAKLPRIPKKLRPQITENHSIAPNFE